MGGSRRFAAALVMAVCMGTLVGCAQMSNPTYDVGAAGCVGARDETVRAIQERLEADGRLRNGKQVRSPDGDHLFVSAELHRRSADRHDKGDILTWLTDDPDTGDFESVDVNARNYSSWPESELDVRAPGARESRACTGLNVGKTRAQLQCEQDRASGEVQLPAGTDCSDL